jgi:hypothetical protein
LVTLFEASLAIFFQTGSNHDMQNLIENGSAAATSTKADSRISGSPETVEVFVQPGEKVIDGVRQKFSVEISVPNRVGGEVTIPDPTVSGGGLRLRDESGAPIVREGKESSYDAYIRAADVILRYIDEGKLEVKNGTLSPTDKFFQRTVDEPSLAPQRAAWDLAGMYEKNLATVQAGAAPSPVEMNKPRSL